ncbi:MAG: hypothetical protein AAFX85_14185 [Pseudomonadota bacterium]
MFAQLDQNVKQLLDDLQAIDFQRTGVVGVFVFAYVATALLATVERSFNQNFDAPSGRPWYLRVLVLAVVERFERGELCTVGDLADELGLADRRVQAVDGADARKTGFVLRKVCADYSVERHLG